MKYFKEYFLELLLLFINNRKYTLLKKKLTNQVGKAKIYSK